jgi:hypothetical protein
MRQKMPTVAAIVDDFRELLAGGGKVIFASENGHTLDRREPVNPDQVWRIPPDFKPYIPKEKK